MREIYQTAICTACGGDVPLVLAVVDQPNGCIEPISAAPDGPIHVCEGTP